MRFVETPVFTAAVRRYLDDERYRHMQIALMLRPEQGPAIKGSGGLREVRWATPGTGKRGGADQAFYMLFVYSKSDQGDLTAEQTRQLGRLEREEFK